MFGVDRSAPGFVLALAFAVMAIIAIRMVASAQPAGAETTVSAAQPDPAPVVSYRALGTPPGHRLPCSGAGADAEGPFSTMPAQSVDACRSVLTPERVTASVLFDVSPSGQPTNVQISGAPPCLDDSITSAVRGFTYCPKMLRGEPAWRYGERSEFSFVRFP